MSTEVDLAPLPGLLGYRLRRAQSALFACFRERFADLDIRPVQLGILTVVANNKGLRQAALSDALGIAAANLVPLLAELEGRALLDRRPAPADRRVRLLEITERGARLLAECRAREHALEGSIAGALGPAARASLLDLLQRVESACQALDAEEPVADFVGDRHAAQP